MAPCAQACMASVGKASVGKARRERMASHAATRQVIDDGQSTLVRRGNSDCARDGLHAGRACGIIGA